ncbi:MAG: adenosylcobinamide-phosphate synthase CbiB [Pseudomonadota bacterium]
MILFEGVFLALLVAIILDAIFGEPDWLWSRVPHPVVAFGKVIDWADNKFNDLDKPFRQRRVAGLIFGVSFALGSFLLGTVVHLALAAVPFGWIIVSALAAILIAQRSLYDHVMAVATGLETGGIEGGREAVRLIVGRDPDALDGTGISRAAIESTAENFSDGVVAPVFWFALFGLGGIVAYKAINTADSMIGHRNERYEHFGAASAIIDDLVNLIPARLSALLVALATPICGGSFSNALKTVRKDANKHRSPNAGWPEAAMAGGLGLALSGPRSYGGQMTAEPYVNEDGRKLLGPADIRRALHVMIWASILQAGIVALAAL